MGETVGCGRRGIGVVVDGGGTRGRGEVGVGRLRGAGYQLGVADWIG